MRGASDLCIRARACVCLCVCVCACVCVCVCVMVLCGPFVRYCLEPNFPRTHASWQRTTAAFGLSALPLLARH